MVINPFLVDFACFLPFRLPIKRGISRLKNIQLYAKGTQRLRKDGSWQR
jgi:hypothetical protein